MIRYKQNGGRDIDDEKYRSKNEIRRVIYSIHQERDIDWSYREIEAFIQDCVERNINNVGYVDNYRAEIGDRVR